MAYYFRLPLVTDLTEDQQMALEEVNPIAISGGAGTGKTVVSLWRHIQNIDVLQKSSMITTYTKTLHYYILESAKLSSEEAWKYVWTSGVIYTHYGNWKIDEIIIDEAQDLTLKHLEDMKKYAIDISYGADFGQQLYNKRVKENEIQNLFPQNIEYNLQMNFRNTYHILNFIKGVFVNRYIDQNSLDELKDDEDRKGIKPIVIISNNFDKEIDKIISIINEFRSDNHNIAILLPFQDGRNRNGEIRDISYKQSVDKYYQALTNRGIICSHYYNKMNIDKVAIELDVKSLSEKLPKSSHVSKEDIRWYYTSINRVLESSTLPDELVQLYKKHVPLD